MGTETEFLPDRIVSCKLHQTCDFAKIVVFVIHTSQKWSCEIFFDMYSTNRSSGIVLWCTLVKSVHIWWRQSPFHSERRKNSVTGSEQHKSWNIWSICSRPWNEAFTIDALSLFSQIFDSFEWIEIFRVGRKASVTFYRLEWDWGITMGICSQNCVDRIGNVLTDECQSTIFVWWRDHGFDVFHIVDFVFFGSRAERLESTGCWCFLWLLWRTVVTGQL